jgi:hypothetical protein
MECFPRWCEWTQSNHSKWKVCIMWENLNKDTYKAAEKILTACAARTTVSRITEADTDVTYLLAENNTITTAYKFTKWELIMAQHAVGSATWMTHTHLTMAASGQTS